MPDCPTCGQAGIYVAAHNVPDMGPLEFPNITLHRHDGAAIYHPNLDSDTHGTRLYP